MRLVKFQTATGSAWAAKQSDDRYLALEGDVLGDFTVSERQVQPLNLLAPVVSQSIFAVGANYASHLAEARAMGLHIPDMFFWFMKAPGSLLNPDGFIRIPVSDYKIDYEAELCIVLKKDACNLTADNALEHVLGLTVANDVSARGWQMDRQSGPSIAKSFDTFCPIGPQLVTLDELPADLALDLQTRVNGQVVQAGNTGDMIYDITALLVELSRNRTLPAGAAILTGNPPGSQAFSQVPCWLKAGDVVEVEIEGVGILHNEVVGP